MNRIRATKLTKNLKEKMEASKINCDEAKIQEMESFLNQIEVQFNTKPEKGAIPGFKTLLDSLSKEVVQKKKQLVKFGKNGSFERLKK